MNAKSIFIEGGEIGSLMRSLDWSQTPLGDVADWPQSLRSAISILLPSKAQICLFWGPELIALYNDAYRPVLASKHPQSFGRPAREVWSEVWNVLEPLLKGVVATGVAFWAQDYLFFINRHGYIEETYFDVSYDPVRDESGSVGGVFCIVSETTGRVLGDRRLQTLSLLASETARAKTVETAYLAAIQALATNSHDIPFAMLYRVEADGRQASLIGTAGIDAGKSATPAKVDLTQECDGWELRRVYETGESAIVSDLAVRFEALPAGAWDKPPSAAWVVPLSQAGQKQIVGLLILGINPHRAFEQEYRKFFDLVVGNVTTAIANARAYEEERKRVEALAELDRAKTTFFNNVSHEFRTPLTLMLSPLEETLTEFEGVLPAKVRSQLEMVQRNGTRLLKLVNTLLDFSRIEAGRTQASYEPTDLATYTAELASIFRSAIEQAGLQLIVDCPPLPEPVYVDREMWEKIVLNLLSNAFKFTFEGEIAVSLRRVDNGVELVVRDTGTGIPADEIPRLFERFHRVEGAKGRTFEGTGIGLSLVQELAHLHGGAIAVDSTLGQGSTFTVQLPTGTAHLPRDREALLQADRLTTSQSSVSTASRAVSYVEEALGWLPELGIGDWGLGTRNLGIEGDEDKRTNDQSPIPNSQSPIPNPQSPIPNPQSPVPNPAHILLVDDNADMRGYLHRILSQFYEVEVVADGETALAAVHSRTPDLVLSDVMMPGINGFELLRRLRADSKTREIPILLLSARAGEESAVEGLEAGADDYLVKPFSRRELLARVAANLELGRSRSESARRQIQLYADVVRNTQVGIVVWQLEDSNDPGSFRLLIANPAASEITGVNFEPLIGTTMAESFSTLLQTPLVQQYVTVVQTGQSLDLGEVSYSDDGITAGIYSLKAFPLPDRCFGLAFENITARKKVEAQLKESLHYSQQIVGAMPGILFVYDIVEQQTVYISPQITDLLGYTSEQLQSMGSNLFAKIIYADDIPHLFAYFEAFRAAPDGIVHKLEYRVHHANGDRRWMYSQSVVFNRTAQGVPRQILGVSIDVTDRKQAELVLVEQNRLLEFTAAGHPLDECLSSACASVSKLNPGVRACILLTDAQRLTFKDSITPEFPPSFAAGLKDAPINELAIGTCGTAVYCGQPITCADIAHDDRWSQEWRNLCLSHDVLACYSAPILDADSLALGSLMICFDEARMPTAWEYRLAEFATHIASIIFERDRSNLALRESEEKYRTLTELSTHHVWMLDTTGELVFLNQSFSDFCGKTLDDLKRANWAKNIHHPDDRDRVVQTIAGAMATGTKIRSEHRIRRHDNQFRWFLHEAIPLRDANGEITHWLGASIDIDDIKQAQEALRESEELKQRILESTQDCIKVLTLNSEILYMSRGGLDLLEIEDSTSVLNVNWLSLWQDEDYENAKAAIAAAKAGGKGQFQGYFPTMSGKSKWWDSVISPIRDASGQVVQLVGISRDITEQKQAEDLLRQSEERFQAFMNHSPAAAWITDRDGRMLYLSQTYFRTFQFPSEDPIGKTVFDIYPADIAQQFLDNIRQAADTREVVKTMEIAPRCDGTMGDFLVYKFPIEDESGVVLVGGVAIDITERIQAEAALRESEELKQRILESSSDCIKVLTLDGRILYMNAAGSELFEMDNPTSLLNAEWVSFWHGEDRENAKAAIAAAKAGHVSQFQGYCPTAKGTPKWWDVIVTPIREASGQVVQLLSISRDMTQQKQADDLLRESEERFRTLADNIAQFAWTADENGAIFWYNQRWFDYTGTTWAEMEGWGWQQVHHPEHVERVTEKYCDCIEAGETWEDTFPLRGKDGQYRWFLSRAIPIRNEQGKVLRWFGTNTDINERISHEAEREQLLQREQTAREAAENANRIKDEFLAVLSHELRSPLSPILGWTSLLRTGRLDAAKTAYAVEIIERNAKLQVQLIEDLLDTSRILSGKLSLNVMPVDLHAVITAALETVRLAAEAKSLKIQMTISPAVEIINGDAGRLQQVLWNLLSNAVKFTPQGGQITVALTESGTHAQIQVTDTGKGINPEFLPYVFDHFRQEDGATTRKFGGLGLGLAIVRHLVELHGGTVQADSAGEGQGAIFTVKLPLPRYEDRGMRNEQIPVSPMSAALPLSNVQVLVVDDDPDTRELIVFILEQAGAIVTAVPSAIAVLEALSRGKPNVLISDIGMPEMDGYMLMKEIRTVSQDNQLLAIALTAYAGEIDRQQALAAGFQGHLSKPIEPERLVQTVASLIEKGSLADDAKSM